MCPARSGRQHHAWPGAGWAPQLVLVLVLALALVLVLVLVRGRGLAIRCLACEGVVDQTTLLYLPSCAAEAEADASRAALGLFVEVLSGIRRRRRRPEEIFDHCENFLTVGESDWHWPLRNNPGSGVNRFATRLLSLQSVDVKRFLLTAGRRASRVPLARSTHTADCRTIARKTEKISSGNIFRAETTPKRR